MLRAVENEAQLAFILGHEIAHVTQEHMVRQMEFHKKRLSALAMAAAAAASHSAHGVRDILNRKSAAIANRFARYLENQADRLGMEYMVAAGYDPREAPRAWEAMSVKYGDASTNLFWSNHGNNAARKSYLMGELRNNFAGTDFSALRRDGEQFRRISSR